MINELIKNGLSITALENLSYKSSLGKSLANSLRKFKKDAIFDEIESIIQFYQESEVLEEIDLDYRIKSKDSCLRKYQKYYPEMRLEKTLNDILGFRMLVNNYDDLIAELDMFKIRIADMSGGKSIDDGYRGIHIYYQIDHSCYPIEIQANTYYDRQINNWLHKYLYKKEYPNAIGRILREKYEAGKIINEKMFKEELENVLFSSKEI